MCSICSPPVSRRAKPATASWHVIPQQMPGCWFWVWTAASAARTARLFKAIPTRGGGVCNGAGWSAGVVHNAIEPHRSLAALTLELMAMRLGSSTLPNHVLPLRAGIVVIRSADRSRVSVRNGRVELIALASSGPADGTWSAGIGPEALLIEAGKVIGITCSDPYLVVRDGLLISADGKSETSLFYRYRRSGQSPSG